MVARERLFNAGAETVGSTRDEFANKVKSEYATLSKVIRDAGIPVEK